MKADTRYGGHHIAGGGGAKLYVESTGDKSKPAIVFLHGFSQCRLSWDLQFQSELAKEFHLVRYDIRGHGLSDKPAGAEPYQDTKLWADDLAAVIAEFKLAKPVLCGWSYGGYMICDYIRHHGQDHVGGIDFVDAVTEMGSDRAVSMFGADLLAMVGDVLSADGAVLAQTIPKFIDLCFYEPVDMYAFYTALGYNHLVLPHTRQAMFGRTIDNTDVMKGITVPTLVSQGQNDRLVNMSAADNIAQLVKGAQRKTYAKCGHVCFVEHAQEFNSDLAAFARACAK